jgi:hypothetical protein
MRRKYRPFSVQRFKHLVYSKISTITPRVSYFTPRAYNFLQFDFIDMIRS